MLDSELADQHVTPALDVLRTGTRREDMLLPTESIAALKRLRQRLAPLEANQRLEEIVKLLESSPDNDAVIKKL